MAKRTVQGLRLSEQDFIDWRSHAVTEKVRRYLRDLAAHVREQWARGEGWTEENRRYVDDLDDFEDLRFEDIEAFYASEESDEQAE